MQTRLDAAQGEMIPATGNLNEKSSTLTLMNLEKVEVADAEG